HLTAILDVEPTLVASDLAADYGSTRLAEAMDLPHHRLQHHAAHVAAVAAEHQMAGPVVGVALDGHGIGPGGANWGGELLMVDGGNS
ncbi:carbamoyltransferase HypF, partial [Mycobacterium tuberculosis]|nr:carbamoyltransferase HypF [Mycobacterium tuberculosis]